MESVKSSRERFWTTMLSFFFFWFISHIRKCINLFLNHFFSYNHLWWFPCDSSDVWYMTTYKFLRKGNCQQSEVLYGRVGSLQNSPPNTLVMEWKLMKLMPCTRGLNSEIFTNILSQILHPYTKMAAIHSLGQIQ